MLAWARSARQRLVLRSFRHPTGGTACTICSEQGIIDTVTINQVHTTPDPLSGQNSSSFPPPQSERDEGAVLKPALWTNPGTASVALLVIGLPALRSLSLAIEPTLQTKQYKKIQHKDMACWTPVNARK